MGLCPRHPGPQHSVLRAPDPWNTGMDERVELAGVQMPPLPLRGLIAAGQLPATLRAVPAAAFGVLDMKLNLRRLDVQLHVSNLPRSGHAENLLIEIRVEHRPCLPGKAAFSLPKLPRKIPAGPNSSIPSSCWRSCPWKKPSMVFFTSGNTQKRQGLSGVPIAASCSSRL